MNIEESPQDISLKTNLKILIVAIWFIPIVVSSFILAFYNQVIGVSYLAYLLINAIGIAFILLAIDSPLMIMSYLVARKFIRDIDINKALKAFRIIYVSSSFAISPIIGFSFWRIFMINEISESFDPHFDLWMKSSIICFAGSLLLGEILIQILTRNTIKKYERLPL